MVKTHGVRGFVKCACTTEYPELIPGREKYLLCDPQSGEALEVKLAEYKPQQGAFLARFEGFDAPEPLKRFGSWDLCFSARRGELPRDDPQEAYLFELQDMLVKHADGRTLGKVTAVIDSGAHTLLELDDAQQTLIPFTRQWVPSLDLDSGELVTTYPVEDGEQ